MRCEGNPARIFLETDMKDYHILCADGAERLEARMKQPPQTALLACGPRIWIGGKACHMPTCTRHCMKRANLSLFFNKRA
jgi:hypothetical protein